MSLMLQPLVFCDLIQLQLRHLHTQQLAHTPCSTRLSLEDHDLYKRDLHSLASLLACSGYLFDLCRHIGARHTNHPDESLSRCLVFKPIAAKMYRRS